MHLYMRRIYSRYLCCWHICKYDGKVKLIASGFGEAQTQSTINDPTAKVQPCHGSSML